MANDNRNQNLPTSNSKTVAPAPEPVKAEEKPKFTATDEVATRRVQAERKLVVTSGVVYARPNGERVYAPEGCDISDMCKEDFDHFRRNGVIESRLVEVNG